MENKIAVQFSASYKKSNYTSVKKISVSGKKER